MKYLDRITEVIVSGKCLPQASLPGVDLQTFVSKACGASAFSTGTAIFQVGAELPYHTHKFSEGITILEGCAQVLVEGRAYRLSPFDCIHIPAGIAHCVRNTHAINIMVAHWAMGSEAPTRNFVDPEFRFEDRDFGESEDGDPENIKRFAKCATYELAEGTVFCDLFAHRFGSVGICGGYGRFGQGSSLPCHFHEYDESITIISGEALCLVQGNQYRLSGYDTAFVPKHRPHRFLNNSEKEMAMLWVYSGDEPDRMVVDAGYCSGSLVWPS
jgi:quercetin dioxygenase-like cupin family protein